MTLYRQEITGIEIYEESEIVAKVECFDEVCSVVKLTELAHTPASWRELSAQIEAALLAIHPGKN